MDVTVTRTDEIKVGDNWTVYRVTGKRVSGLVSACLTTHDYTLRATEDGRGRRDAEQVAVVIDWSPQGVAGYGHANGFYRDIELVRADGWTNAVQIGSTYCVDPFTVNGRQYVSGSARVSFHPADSSLYMQEYYPAGHVLGVDGVWRFETAGGYSSFTDAARKVAETVACEIARDLASNGAVAGYMLRVAEERHATVVRKLESVQAEVSAAAGVVDSARAVVARYA